MDINCLWRSSYFSALIFVSLPGSGNLKACLSVSQIRLFSRCRNLRKILPCPRTWLSMRWPDIPHCTGTQTLCTSSNPFKYLLCLLLCSPPIPGHPSFCTTSSLKTWVLASHSPRDQRLRKLALSGGPIGNEWWKWLEQTNSSFILFLWNHWRHSSFGMLSLAPVWVNMLSEQICVSGFHFGAAPSMKGTQIALLCLLFSLFPLLSFSQPRPCISQIKW